jgi:hypothetical protein
MTTNDNELEKFNTVLRKILAVPRAELLKREKEWKKEQARKKWARVSPASRASTAKD